MLTDYLVVFLNSSLVVAVVVVVVVVVVVAADLVTLVQWILKVVRLNDCIWWC